MTQEEFKNKIEDLNEAVHDLTMDGGVIADTALYGFLSMANYALTLAAIHCKEHNEDCSNNMNHKTS